MLDWWTGLLTKGPRGGGLEDRWLMWKAVVELPDWLLLSHDGGHHCGLSLLHTNIPVQPGPPLQQIYSNVPVYYFQHARHKLSSLNSPQVKNNFPSVCLQERVWFREVK